jgi:pilus assembly protein CpaC
VPTVLGGDVIDMRVYVEVSEPDFASGTRITGIQVPGFVSRKGRTHLRVDNGMTFAMAGLLSENTVYARSEVPGLGRIPLIGTLFRYTRHVREETELLIMVTPRLVRPLAPGEVPAAPGTTENNNPSDVELFLFGMGHRTGSRSAKPTADVGLQR